MRDKRIIIAPIAILFNSIVAAIAVPPIIALLRLGGRTRHYENSGERKPQD